MTNNPYGLCPLCGAPGVSRERKPNGNDRCFSGHEYPSSEAVGESSTLHKYYFTYGYGHTDLRGRPLVDCYTIIEAETHEQARKHMFEIRGSVWCFSYDEEEFKALEVPFGTNMKEISLEESLGRK